MKRSIKVDLIYKSREAMLSAVQAFNNPLATFKTETFIVLAMIAWTYLLHSFYKKQKVEFRYLDPENNRRFLKNEDGSYKYWGLSDCLKSKDCPLDATTKKNLEFLIGLRNHIEHHKPKGLDTYLSARYQACALNFNFYVKKLHGEKYSLNNHMALSLQFAELDYNQAEIMKNKEEYIPKEIKSYIAEFDSKLPAALESDDRYAYRLLFTKVIANRAGQADRVIEFIDPNSEMAKTISKEFWIKKETEKNKFRAKDVIKKVAEAGIKGFGPYQHTQLWKKYDGKNPDKGFGVFVTDYWYWYQKWIDFIIATLSKS